MEKWVLPDGWEWKKLGEESLLEIIMGQSPPGESYNDEGNGLPFFQGKTDFGDYYPTPKKWCTSPTKISLPGDVLICVRAPVGPTNLTAEKCAIGRGLTILRPKTTLQTKFLLYALRSLERQISEMGKGSTFVAITKSDLEQIEIPFAQPDIQTQVVTRIEKFLAELAEARRLHEKIVADTNRLMDAVLAEYFPKFEVALPEGWEWKPISFLAHDTDRLNPTTTAPNEYFNYIDISSVDNAIGAVTNPKSLLGQDAPSRARKIVHTNDVIFATTRPYLKNIALIPPDLDHSICSTGFCVLVPKADNCIPQYLYYAARSESVIQQLIPKQRGASYPAVLDQDVFGSFIPIPYPGDPERSKTSQQIITERITKIGESVLEAQLANTKTGALLNQMEQSILAQAFRGEL